METATTLAPAAEKPAAPKISESRIRVRMKHMGETREEATAGLEALDKHRASFSRKPIRAHATRAHESAPMVKREKPKKAALPRIPRDMRTKKSKRAKAGSKATGDDVAARDAALRALMDLGVPSSRDIEQFICDFDLPKDARRRAFELARELVNAESYVEGIRAAIIGQPWNPRWS